MRATVRISFPWLPLKVMRVCIIYSIQCGLALWVNRCEYWQMVGGMAVKSSAVEAALIKSVM